jgi:hypothetical protein
MASMTDLREGIAANLASIANVQVSAVAPANPTPPSIWVEPDPVEGVVYDRAMARGLDLWTFLVWAVVPAASVQGGQAKLDGYIASSGSSSVKAAVEADKTLGGAAMDARVTRCAGYQPYVREGLNGVFLACQWTVEVHADGRT